MNVALRPVLVSNYDVRGGAACAAHRLHTDLRAMDADSTLFVLCQHEASPHASGGGSTSRPSSASCLGLRPRDSASGTTCDDLGGPLVVGLSRPYDVCVLREDRRRLNTLCCPSTQTELVSPQPFVRHLDNHGMDHRLNLFAYRL
jgi:hypothetical protein